MDFGQILHKAQKNEKTTNNGVRYYSTKFEPPKKIKKNQPELSDNIKKFLAKKEAEEKRKVEEERKKRDELLALRSQDKKATRRVNVMLKRTKSANQSVIDDAFDKDNTAVTLAGPLQPDEDDYGYVSQEASAFYNQMMEKYSKMPDEPKFDLTKKKVSTNLSSTKDRVRAALEKEKEEAMMPHRRKRKHKEGKEEEEEDVGVSYNAPDRGHEEQAQVPKPKPKPKMAPPPLNFAELLKIAEKKQHEPIIIEKKEKEEESLLTKKQKKEKDREREYQQRREERRREMENGRKPTAISEKAAQKGKPPDERIPKLSDAARPLNRSNGDRKSDHASSSQKSTSSSRETASKATGQDQKTPGTSKSGKSKRPESPVEEVRPNRRYLPGDTRYRPEVDGRKSPSEVFPAKKNGHNGQSQTKQPSSDDNFARKLPSSDALARKNPPGTALSRKVPTSDAQFRKHPPTGKDAQARKPGDTPSRKASASDVSMKKSSSGDFASRKMSSADASGRKVTSSEMTRLQNGQVPSRKGSTNDEQSLRVPPKKLPPKQFPPADLKLKQFPPADLRPKQFPPGDVRRREDFKKKPMGNKRRILDDDEDYDSEMDDFIDDDEPDVNYSKYISEIFGYDKSRYRDLDDDVDNMESTFAQQMREEVISTKIGIMEDLEDMRQEEEEKKRKKLKKRL